MLAMQDASQPFPVQADLSVGGTRAAVVGTLRDPASLAALDLRLAVGRIDGAAHPLTGVTLPDTPPYSTDGHLVARLRRQGGAVFDWTSTARSAIATCTATYPSRWRAAPKLTGKLVRCCAWPTWGR